MPKIALHVSRSVNTGLAHCLEGWVGQQVADGWHVVVASPGGRLGEVAEAAGARTIRWEARREPGLSSVREVAALREVVRAVRPDVLHLHCAKAGLAGRFVVRGRIPTVFSPHAWSFLAAEGVVRTAALQWERAAARWTDVYALVSEAERRTARAHGISGASVVLPNQVDLSGHADVVHATPAAARASVGARGAAPLVVCAARLAPQKGQDVLLRAWVEVRREVPDAELVLVGDGPDRAAVEAVAATLDGIRLVGELPREETLTWMRAADVVVCPSRWEGMSLVPLEARALGRPVVATSVDGMEEALADGGGLLVPPCDSAGLGAALLRALRGDVPPAPPSRDGDPSSARRLVEAYERLLAERPLAAHPAGA